MQFSVSNYETSEGSKVKFALSYYLLRTTYYVLLTTCYSLLTTHYLLLTILTCKTTLVVFLFVLGWILSVLGSLDRLHHLLVARFETKSLLNFDLAIMGLTCAHAAPHPKR